MRFRILFDGYKYKAQYKGWFFWKTFSELSDWGRFEFYRTFDSEEEAERYIERKRRDFGVQPWTVTKTFNK